MALFDIIDDIAERQITKTETGDNRILGVILGTVVKNYDKDMPGRVCVTVPVRDSEANELKWARVASVSSGTGWGHYFLPEVGDQVLLVFEQGNIERPYVIGCIPKDSNRFLKQAVDEKNQYKKIITKNGSQIIFEDNKEGEGEKDKIKIETAKSVYKFEMDNEKKTVTITDKEGKNKLLMKTENGQMEIVAEKNLTIKVGDNIELILNGSNGTTELKTNKFKIEANETVNVNANSNMKLNGGNVALEANATLKLESSGAVTVSGTPIKIG